MLEFVDSGLYFVQDENYLRNPLLQGGSGSAEKITGSGGPKINGSDRIRILIPGYKESLQVEKEQKLKLIFVYKLTIHLHWSLMTQIRKKKVVVY